MDTGEDELMVDVDAVAQEPEKPRGPATPSRSARPLFTERPSRKQDQPKTESRKEDTHRPAFRYQSKLDDPAAAARIYLHVLEAPITNPIDDLYAISPDLLQHAVVHERTSRVPVPPTSSSNSQGALC